MKKIPTIVTNEINVENIKGYFERAVTKFGTGAKIDCPKEYLGENVIVLVLKKRA
jgi:putative transposon-encoded protein